MEHALQTWSQSLWIFHLQGYATEERLITIRFRSFLPNSTASTRFFLRHVKRSFGVWLSNWRNVKCWQRTSVHEGGKRHKQKFVTQTTSSMDEQCRDSLSPLAHNTHFINYTYRGHNMSVFTPPESYLLLQFQDYPSVPCVLPYTFLFHHRNNNNNNNNNLETESVMKILVVNFHQTPLSHQNILPSIQI